MLNIQRWCQWRLLWQYVCVVAAGLSRDGGVVLIKRLGCYPADNADLLFPVSQLAVCGPHVLRVCLWVDATQAWFVALGDLLADTRGEHVGFLHSSGAHESVLPAQFWHYFQTFRNRSVFKLRTKWTLAQVASCQALSPKSSFRPKLYQFNTSKSQASRKSQISDSSRTLTRVATSAWVPSSYPRSLYSRQRGVGR